VRQILKLTLNFGRVPIPVGLAVTRTKGDVEFRTLHRGCGTPIERRSFCPYDDREVAPHELVKGWEISPGEYLLVEDDELEALAPDPGRGIELLAAIDELDLDPLLVDGAYHLVPADHPAGRRAYTLLRDALAEEHALAICRFVGWQRERLAAIAPTDQGAGSLVLWTLSFPADLVPNNPIVEQLQETEVTQSELDLARKLLQRMRLPIAKLDLAPKHRPRVHALLAAKHTGQPITRPQQPRKATPATPPPDLTRALKDSIRDRPTRKRTKKTAAPAR
jgi:DNA end-binding protein Ku